MMSSEISTEPQSLQPWQLFTLAGLVGATAVVFVSRDVGPAAIILLSLVVGAAACAAHAAWRALAPLAGREEPMAPEMLGGRTRAALDREKALVLRSIKELEFDKAMGKISDSDYSEMSARLRARAVRLLRQLDSAAGYRTVIERELAARVGVSANAVVSTEPRASDEVRVDDVPRACPSCATTNDRDARFCKSCGTRLESA